ncbi:MAG: protein kinase [Proteobacteria bacterium]|nr:protein kinase [Pseudomonadota bacterium]
MSEKTRHETNSAGQAELALAATATSVTPSRPVKGVHGPLRAGESLGRYTILHTLGHGGMGVVYAAYDSGLDRKVALKLLCGRDGDGSVSNPESARFLREARAMARLNHPNVITVYDAATESGRDYVAMEFVDGPSLAEWLEHAEPARRNWREVLGKFLLAGRGLRAAHKAGLVHRDFKPANVLMGKDGRVLVTDFGLARLTEPPAERGANPGDGGRGDAGQTHPGNPDANRPAGQSDADIEPLTRTGMQLGTPAYMAPEQHVGEHVDERSDQYSFCVALYEGLYGARPFVGTSIETLTEAKVGGEFADEPKNSPVPKRLRRQLVRGLAADPADRHDSMRDLLIALSRSSRPMWRRVAAAAVAAAAIAVLVVAMALYGQTGEILVPECDTDLAHFVGLWDDQTRTAVESAFRKSKSSSAEAAIKSVARHLDADRRAWREAQGEICKVRHEPVFHARMDCLLEYRERLGGLMAEFARANTDTVEAAVQAVEALPDPRQCSAVAAAGKDRRQLGDPETWQQVRDIRSQLRQVAVLRDALRLEEAHRRIEEITARARDLGNSRVVAEALFLGGELKLMSVETRAARELLNEAALVAEESAHDEMHARALVALATLEGRFSSDRHNARRMARRAAAAVNRYGRDETLQAELDIVRAGLFRDDDAYDEALALLRSARSAFEQANADVEAADVLIAMAAVYETRGEYQRSLELVERAHADKSQILGPDHPESILTRDATVPLLSTLGRHDDAMARWREIEPFWTSERGRQILARGTLRWDGDETTSERTVRGRVVGTSGRPAAGAEVVIVNTMLSDGMHLAALFGGRFEHAQRLQRCTTDQNGFFVLRGVPDRTMVIAAESEKGRSFPVLVPARSDGDGGLGEHTVELRLRGLASVRGVVTLDGEDATRTANWLILLAPLAEGTDGKAFVMVAVREGRFSVPRLAAGRYQVNVTMGTKMESNALTARTIELEPGEVLDLDLAIKERGIRLDALVVGQYGTPIPSAQIVVMPGHFEASTIKELEMLVRERSEGVLVSGIRAARAGSTPGDRPGQLSFSLAGISPGQHTICVVPLSGDVKDPEFLREIFQHREDLTLHCQPWTITAEPTQQSVTIEVPPAKLLRQPGSRPK